MRGRIAAAVAIVAILSGVAFLPSVLSEEDPRPNVIVIVTDDQSADSIPHIPTVMPFLQQRVLDPNDDWIVFQNGFVNTPLCCPSRATMLTGRYPHVTGVQDNDDGHLMDESQTLAAWLQGSGYHTGLVGKYLNLYPFGRAPYIPEGWDRWWGKQQGDATSLYHDFTLIEQGTPVYYGGDDADYSTDVFAAKALEFIREAPADRPFFLWFAPTAPHPPWVSAARHAATYADLLVPAPPSVGEPDVSDKPAWIRSLPAMDAEDQAIMRTSRRRSYEALLAVDDAMRGLVDELTARGELDNTVIVYLSDNGFSFGEHRWIKKSCPYEECIRIPFLIRMPGASSRTETALVSAADLAPTIADLAGLGPMPELDGESLVSLLDEDSHAGLAGAVFAEWVGDEKVPGWWELRTPGYAYIELVTGERELYDLQEDPFELVNVAADPAYAGQAERLAIRLDAYRTS